MPSIVEVLELNRAHDGAVEFNRVHLNLDYVVKATRTQAYGYDCVLVKMAAVPDVVCTVESYQRAVKTLPKNNIN